MRETVINHAMERETRLALVDISKEMMLFTLLVHQNILCTTEVFVIPILRSNAQVTWSGPGQ